MIELSIQIYKAKLETISHDDSFNFYFYFSKAIVKENK